MKKRKNEEREKASRDFIKNVTLMNDWFMTKFFQDGTEEIQEVLRIILDDETLVVKRVETQRRIQNLGHSLSLDVYAEDENGTLHDIEIQRSKEGAGRKRARYHSSMMDAGSLSKNNDFERLPETHVIFITEGDALGLDMPIYHIDRTILESGTLFGDKAHIIYVNVEDRNDRTKLGRLMQDFTCSEAMNMHNEVLRKRMTMLKENEEVREMFFYEKYMLQETEKAEKRAEERLQKKYIKKLLLKGITAEEIKDLLDVSEDTIMKVQKSMKVPS